ncbi:hypothetical protein HPP92_006562 [Vanilla planifolia]|uniref:Uncharacterized protein n=1 Tax=Vanilla planifolia TaxID=51239 RepID=A0A835RH11_VANPL|nr:hypothetical protein HPP92_006821 [Vanilla planifolia]KAG0489699.1 hypothetical protein HPP92_006562 [Vanilla planifolia]
MGHGERDKERLTGVINPYSNADFRIALAPRTAIDQCLRQFVRVIRAAPGPAGYVQSAWPGPLPHPMVSLKA